MKLLGIGALLISMYVFAGTLQYEDEVGMAEERAEQALPPEPPAFRIQTDPVNPPRCPRVNAQGIPLMWSVAAQADGGEWVHECYYGLLT